MTAGRWHEVREILYAVSQVDPADRDRYLAGRCGADVSLRGEVEELLSALTGSVGFLEPVASAAETQIGPYRILDEAGHGGMGVVYRALRGGDYQQIVAIKLVRAELATQLLTERFRLERQTLALLNHPNIARLLDGGTTGDGRPYLVMEWIDGCPIHQYCRERALTTRQLLELFLLVCAAVAYAHRNLVVHRDLKPSNILITTEGQPKLLDFGIAKVFDAEEPERASTLLLAGLHALTPEYASPEQVRQEPVTTATDVYSLGAVLFELLTGAPAHRLEAHTPAAVERAVCDNVPPSASSVAGAAGVPRPDLRGDLDNILAKALEKDPARRYPNVDEFSADLRRHLDCRPVLARPASWPYRAARFTRRNKLLVASAAAVTLALTGGFSVALWQAHRARLGEELAEQRFELARRLAGSVLYEFHDGIRDLQGSLQVQQLVLTRSLEYLDKLSATARSNPALQRDLANGYERVAALAGRPGSSNQGREQYAIQSLRKALELRRQALAANPHSVELRRELARTHRGFVNLEGLPIAEVVEHSTAATALVEALQREAPDDLGIRADLAICEYGMGVTLVKQARYPEAVPYFRKALAHAPADDPANVALYHKHLGAVLITTGDLQAALAEYAAALASDEPRAAANSANVQAKLDLSYDYSDIALIYWDLGQLRESLEQYRKVYRIRKEVAAADPGDERSAFAFASAAWRLAGVLAASGDRRRAEATFRQAVDLAETHRTQFPEMRSGVELLANINLELGDKYRKWGSCGRARPRLDRALELYRTAGNAAGVAQVGQLITACRSAATPTP